MLRTLLKNCIVSNCGSEDACMCVCVCNRTQPKTVLQQDVEPRDNNDDDIEPAWKKKKVWKSCGKPVRLQDTAD